MTGTKSTKVVSNQRAFQQEMKTSVPYIPLFFALVFLSYLLSYAFLDPGFKGFYVEVGGLAALDECRDAEQFVIEVLTRERVRLKGKAVEQGQLLQKLQKAFPHRAERVVYVLANRDVTIEDVVTVIDISNGAAKDAHVRLVTPGNQNAMCLGRDPPESLKHADQCPPM